MTLVRPRLVAVSLLVITLVAGCLASRASADQPRMQAALDALRVAERELEAASADKGGHRANALSHVRKAIDEVQKGIRYDRRH